MIVALIGLFILGLVAGAVARLFIHSPQRLGCLGTALLGIVGSYAGGTLGALIFDKKFDIRQASTIIGAIAGSVVLLGVWRVVDGRRPSSRARVS
ncbi:MAG: GlsB/YeaQ/YmgE family stress response membrane protein [Jatrophihabitans sp.]